MASDGKYYFFLQATHPYDLCQQHCSHGLPFPYLRVGRRGTRRILAGNYELSTAN